jgi:SAM-dependent methyltransferase
MSGMTKTLDNHFRSMAQEVDKMFFETKKHKSVLDIGSNDGTQLKHYRELGYHILGVESSKRIAQIANEADIPTENRFFNLDASKSIGRKFDVINASGIFFHLEELHSVSEGIKESLAEKGIFCVQALYLKNIFENNAFDQIYHEHLLYYTVSTLQSLLQRHDLELFDSYISPIHGGSIIGFASHSGTKDKTSRLEDLLLQEKISRVNEKKAHLDFAERVKSLKKQNLRLLEKKKLEGKSVYGMGAPVKGNTLLNYFGIGPDLIQCLVEKNTLRKGLFSPGMHIPVLLEDELKDNPDTYYVLAWNFKKEILDRYKDKINQGVEFYFPINPKVL